MVPEAILEKLEPMVCPVQDDSNQFSELYFCVPVSSIASLLYTSWVTLHTGAWTQGEEFRWSTVLQVVSIQASKSKLKLFMRLPLDVYGLLDPL